MLRLVYKASATTADDRDKTIKAQRLKFNGNEVLSTDY